MGATTEHTDLAKNSTATDAAGKAAQEWVTLRSPLIRNCLVKLAIIARTRTWPPCPAGTLFPRYLELIVERPRFVMTEVI